MHYILFNMHILLYIQYYIYTYIKNVFTIQQLGGNGSYFLGPDFLGAINLLL